MAKTKDFINYYKKIDWKEIPSLFDVKNISKDNWIIEEVSILKKLYRKEEEDRNRGVEWICGVDEVGRGPMAGPVVSAAVVFKKPLFLPGLNDSKRVVESLRDVMIEIIKSVAFSVSVGMATVSEIDDINIHNASLLAMKRAIDNLSIEPQKIYVDGVYKIPNLLINQETVTKGDSSIYSIAAASIVAKVTRDRMMVEYDTRFPGYSFSKNKGYCTKEHKDAVKRLGITSIHRMSYKPIKDLFTIGKKKPKAEQLNFDYITGKALGDMGEEFAFQYLKKRGLEILERNFRVRQGEIDIIARDGEWVVFVEVKIRRFIHKGISQEAINEKKQNQLRNLADIYLAKNNLVNIPVRFDVIAINWDQGQKRWQASWIKKAF